MKGIKVTSEGFEILNGGFRVVDTDAQNLAVVVKMVAGHSGNAPLIGVNAAKFINAPRSHSVLNSLKKRIKLSLKRDEATVHNVNLSGFPNLEIDASYE